MVVGPRLVGLGSKAHKGSGDAGGRLRRHDEETPTHHYCVATEVKNLVGLGTLSAANAHVSRSTCEHMHMQTWWDFLSLQELL